MAVTISTYNHLLEIMSDGTLDMDNDSFKIILLGSGHSFNAAHTQLSGVSSNEIATANGYTQQTKQLANVTWSQTSGTVTFDADDVVWSASGGSISADYAVIYSDTATNDELICSIAFDGTESAGNGTDFRINWPSTGIFYGSFS